MDRQLETALVDLGLNPVEARLYVALVRHGSEAPVSAYALARHVGRDPANTTRTLAALERHGAARPVGGRPRRWSPVAAADFTETLILRLQSRRRDAVRLLDEVGRPGDDATVHPLRDGVEARQRARALIAGARTVALLDAEASLVAELADDLGASAAAGAAVLVLASGPVAVAGVRAWVDPGAAQAREAAPGPWLHLVADGRDELLAVFHRGDGGRLLAGHWHRGGAAAFLAHRALGASIVHAALQQRLAAGVDATVAARQAREVHALITRRLGSPARSRDLAWPELAPAGGEGPPAVPAAEVPPAGANPLQFVHRRRRS